eukprot:3411250-Pyramimonas_sp.AAC.1
MASRVPGCRGSRSLWSTCCLLLRLVPHWSCGVQAWLPFPFGSLFWLLAEVSRSRGDSGSMLRTKCQGAWKREVPLGLAPR